LRKLHGDHPAKRTTLLGRVAAGAIPDFDENFLQDVVGVGIMILDMLGAERRAAEPLEREP
jgi:hypothetical protein